MKYPKLYVYLYLEDKWMPIGILKADGSAMTFRYGLRYLESPAAISIDPPHLPLIDKEHVLPPGFDLFNGIRDAGPDRWGNYLLSKRYGRELTELESSLFNTADRVGALAFGVDLQGPKLFEENKISDYRYGPYIDLERCVEALSDIENNEDTHRLQEYLHYGPSLGGARPKTTVRWKDALYLAKFSLSTDLKNEPRTEFASMTLARKCGLEIPDLELAQVLGRDVFLIKRFDRKESGSPIHFISALTAAGIHETEYRRFDYNEIAAAIRSLSFRPERDLYALFRQLVFNVFINNSDDHLRNFGFLYQEGKGYALSPAYDLTSTLVRNRKSSLSLRFGSFEKQASLSNLKSAYQYLGLEEKICDGIISEIGSAISTWKEHYRTSGVSEEDIKKLEKSFEVI